MVGIVGRMDDHSLEAAGLDIDDLAADFGDDRLSLGLSGLEQLDDSQQTAHLVLQHLQNGLDRPDTLALHSPSAPSSKETSPRRMSS